MKRPSLTKSQPAAVWAIAVAVRENDVDDARADLDRRRLGGEVADLADGVERVRLGHPDEVEAGALEVLDTRARRRGSRPSS